MNIKQLPSFTAGVIRGLFVKSSYNIKRGYRHRKEYIQYDDRNAKDESQREVYQEARRIMVENNFKTILDYGCGSAYKLVNNFSEFDTIGLEVSPTYEYLKKTYPDKTWYKGDEVDHKTLSADLIVCADVIEHVIDPDSFIQKMLEIPDVKYYLISTPDRDTVRGKLDYGPPINKHHIREWNLYEFRHYLSRFFHIEEHKLVNVLQSNQLILGRKKDN